MSQMLDRIMQIEVMDDERAEILRKFTPSQRVWVVGNINTVVRKVIRHSLQVEHPDWDEARIQAEVAGMMLKRDDDEG